MMAIYTRNKNRQFTKQPKVLTFAFFISTLITLSFPHFFIAYLEDDKAASIPIGPYDPTNIKRMALFLEDRGNSQFREVRFIEPYSFTMPAWLQEDYYFPYEILSFRIEAMDLADDAAICITSEAEFVDSLKAFVQMDKDQWEGIAVARIDERTITLTLNDSQTGDGDREKNDAIDTRLALDYPAVHTIKPLESDTIELQGAGCFLSAVMSK